MPPPRLPMKRSDFEERLRELRRASTSVARAKMLLAELIRTAPIMDHPLAERLRQTAADRGLVVAPIVAKPLEVGESWLLLFEPPNLGHAVRLRASFSPGKDDPLDAEVRRAFRGLVATAAREGRHLDHRAPPTLTIDAPFAHFDVEGSSLGLSVAIAAASAATQRAADSRVAATAQVRDDGTLAPVEHLPEKLEALARAQPQVTSVIVAANQDLRGYEGPIQLLKWSHLGEALTTCGLSLEVLPQANLDAFCARIAHFRAQNNRANDTEDWKRLSMEAWETAKVLALHDADASGAASVFSALFAVHGGDPRGADAVLQREAKLDVTRYPELHARRNIAAATAAIDEDDLPAAKALAEEAVQATEGLSGRDRRELLGEAYGTLGRVLLHAGALAEAEGFLRKGMAHHDQECPTEAPRSACYVATCLRRMGRLDEALEAVNTALEKLAPQRWNLHATTKSYLHLERGRIRLASGDARGAIEDLELVRDAQNRDSSYPRLGAQRSLATAYRIAGDTERADDTLRACVAVARAVGTPRTIARVAAVAAGEALLGEMWGSVEREGLEDAWRRAFGDAVSEGEIRERLGVWVY